jgi:hypothetical protein
MNVFGIDVLQLIIYACVVASFVIIAYILKLTRNRNKTKTLSEPKPSEETFEETFSNIGTVTTPNEIIKQLIALVDKMYSHQVGLNPSSNTCPTPTKRRTRNKPEEEKKPEPAQEPEIKELPPPPTPSHSIQKIDEEAYTPTDEDNELLETIRKQLGEK